MNNVAKQAASAADQSGPVAHVSPGPSYSYGSYDTLTRVMDALESGLMAVRQSRRIPGATHEFHLRAGLAAASGYLLADESDISEKLWQILREATA